MPEMSAAESVVSSPVTIPALSNVAQDRLRFLRLPLLILVVLGIVLFGLTQDISRWSDVIRQSGWVGLVIAVGLYALIGASPIPSEPLTLFLAVTFNPLVATLVAGLGNLLAGLVEYAIGRMAGDIVDLEKKRQKLPLGLSKFPLESPLVLIGARLIPLYAPKIISLASGAYHVPLRRYLWTTAIVTFGGAALLAYGGNGLLNLHK
jgi:uncharacterized membrane protein YdjX (TVP38/TMEM64 family)